MGGALWNLLFFFIVLGILVTIHEFGHYLAARLCGVKVYRFCLGFGPVIFRKVRANGEEFAIALLPLGGYVKMKGESADVTALQSAGVADSAIEAADKAQARPAAPKNRWGNLGGAADERADVGGAAGGRAESGTAAAQAPGAGAGAFETDFAQVRTGTKADSAFSTASTQQLLRSAERTARSNQATLSDSFADKKIWQRTAIIAAGPIFNIILAFLIYIVINCLGTTAPLPVVDSIVPGSIAERSGFLPQDRIMEIEGRPVYTGPDAWMTLGSLTGKSVALTVQGDFGAGPKRALTLDLSQYDIMEDDLFTFVGFAQSYGQMAPDISFIEADSPAAEAGLLPGDIIVAVNGRKVTSFAQAVATLRDEYRRQQLKLLGPIPEDITKDYIDQAINAGYAPLKLTIVRRHWAPGQLPPDPAADIAANTLEADSERARNQEAREAWYAGLSAVAQARATVTPESSETLTVTVRPFISVGTHNGVAVPRLGMGAIMLDSSQVWTEVSYGPIETVVKAFNDTVNGSLLIFRALEAMVVGDVGLKAVSGPVAIATIAGETASLGLAHFLMFLAILSINLGWMNLIPIPVLDGGQLLYLAYEKLVGRPPSDRAQNILSVLGLSLILGLTCLAIFNDLSYWL